ncbi:MAG: flavodoxin-dependent (E)-4-hydroxy-3-methylbut-2-enyl-diphosphate synthase [Elusimicrobiota bacterium]
MKKTKVVKVGKLKIGGGNPIPVQSMTTTDTKDIIGTISQIKKLTEAGCEIVRVAISDMDAAKAVGKIKKAVDIPVVADIHFDYRLAVESAKQGIDKIRINPGNIGDKNRIKEVVAAAKDKNIPIRIGVNAGSLKALKKHNTVKWSNERWAEEMVREAMENIEILDSLNFNNIIVSLKADDPQRTIMANELFSKKTDIPLHLGVTEAGTLIRGVVNSSITLSKLLMEGIGDTIRISLTEDPLLEVRVGYEILKSLGLRSYGPDIISCPTCGRCQVNLSDIVHKLENEIYSNAYLLKKSTGKKIAVMGCVVNGPGEAKHADFGICGGKGKGIWIEKGKQVRVIKESEWINQIIRKIREV